jgi:uncharacterized membrane protein YgcG
MKKRSIIGLSVIFLLLIYAMPLYAAAVPERAGLVTDTAGLFTSSEKNRIEHALADRKHELFVLTSSGLSEQEGERLANDAYDSWGLSADQLVLVITTGPNFVHLVYEDAAWDTRVSQSGAGDAKGVVERTFVPLAGDGKLAEGVVAVSDYVNSLDGAAGGSPAASPQRQKSGLSVAAVAAIAGGIVVLAIVFLLVRRLMLAASVRRRLAETRLLHKEADTAISGMVVSDFFKELEMGFVQGETKEKVAALEQAALALQQTSGQLQERLAGQRVSPLSAAASKQSAEQLHAEVQQLAEQTKRIQAEIGETEGLFKEIRKSVEQSKARIAAISTAVDALRKQTGYPLNVMQEELENGRSVLAKADGLDEFDLLQAQEWADKTEQLLTALEASSALFGELSAQRQAFGLRVKAREEELRQTVGREQLLLTDADPFAMLRQAEQEAARLGTLLETGNVNEAKESAAGMEALLAQAGEAVGDMVRSRNTAGETVRGAVRLLAELNAFPQAYQQELQRLKEHFADVHLQEQSARYAEIQQARSELERLLVDLKASLDERVQQYKLAGEQSAEADGLISRIQNLREQTLAYRERSAWSRSCFRQGSAITA